MSEIRRTKKELAFAQKKMKNSCSQAPLEGPGTQMGSQKATELENSMKLVETIDRQKRVLETEN